VLQVAASTVPASSARRAIVEEWLCELIVRATLALLALWALTFAADRYVVFKTDYAANFKMDTEMWLAWIGSAAGAGMLFGLSAWLSFTKVRYL
jgi:hypothetical protein